MNGFRFDREDLDQLAGTVGSQGSPPQDIPSRNTNTNTNSNTTANANTNTNTNPHTNTFHNLILWFMAYGWSSVQPKAPQLSPSSARGKRMHRREPQSCHHHHRHCHKYKYKSCHKYKHKACHKYKYKLR